MTFPVASSTSQTISGSVSLASAWAARPERPHQPHDVVAGEVPARVDGGDVAGPEGRPGQQVVAEPDGGRDLRERHPGRDRLARLLVAGLWSRRRNVVAIRPGDPVDDEGARALGLGRGGALPLPGVAGVADEHQGGRLAGCAPRQPRPRVPARLGHEEGRQVRSGWLAAARSIGALRLAQLRSGVGVGEGHEPTPALERADVPTGIRAGWGELVVVASHRDGLAVELARPQQLISIGDADHRQTGDLRWKRRGRRQGRDDRRRRCADAHGRRHGGAGGRRGARAEERRDEQCKDADASHAIPCDEPMPMPSQHYSDERT